MKKTFIAAGIAIFSTGAAMAQAASPPAAGGPGEQIIRQEQPAGPGATLNVSPAVVRQIQQALNQKGYQAGNVDGEWNDSSKQAMTQFQKAQGLEPTGNINQRTLAALGINPTAAVGAGAGGGGSGGGSQSK